MLTRASIAFSLLALMSGRPALAQDAGVRRAWSFGVGAGAGWLSQTCDVCSTSHLSAPSAYLQAGVHLRPSLRLGIEANGWRKTINAYVGTQTRVNVTVSGYLYPVRRVTGFLALGVGLASVHGRSDSLGTASAQGLGALLGAGYDLRLTDRVALTARASYLLGRYGDAPGQGGVTLRNRRYDLTQLTLGLTVNQAAR